MKSPVSDEAVAEYAVRLRESLPLGTLFPARMSDCDFTEAQRQVIRQARADRRDSLKNAKAQPASVGQAPKPTNAATIAQKVLSTTQNPKALSKLSKMLYLQSGRCFFCGEPLMEAEASIEHLNPKSRGGTSTEDNEVACHKSLNETFGGMDLKRKFAFVLKSAGSFRCPKK